MEKVEFHIEDNLDIKVTHTSEMYHIFRNRNMILRKGCVQNVDVSEGVGRYSILPVASPLQFWIFTSCIHHVASVFMTSTQSLMSA